MRPSNIVSTKLALYSNDLQSVLVMHYPARATHGLPGGHVESKEHPDDAIRRELMEELTLSVDGLKRTDFFLRGVDRGPIILAYTAIAPADVSIVPTDPDFEYAQWISKDELAHTSMSPEYVRFVLQNWPSN